MNNLKHETIEDIAAEIRRLNPDTFLVSKWFREPLPNRMRSYADRIEAAHKREREAGAEAAQICGEIGEMVGREAACHQPVTDCNGLNAAAMREALENVRFYLPHFLQYMRLHCEDAEAGGYYEKILEVVNAALSAPPRNCDVGTAEEQSDRLDAFCLRHNNCSSCPCKYTEKTSCYINWARMPYEEGCVK